MNLVYDTIFREQHDFEFGRMVRFSSPTHIIFHSSLLTPRCGNSSGGGGGSNSSIDDCRGPINAVYRNRCLFAHTFPVQQEKESLDHRSHYNDEDGSFHEISAIKYDCCLAFSNIQYIILYSKSFSIMRFYFILYSLFIWSHLSAVCFFLDN